MTQANCFEFVTWDQALSEANTLVSGRCGLSDGSVAGDWRLPNLKELMSLIGYAFPQGTNALAVFADIGHVYWTSSTLVFDPDQAWIGISKAIIVASAKRSSRGWSGQCTVGSDSTGPKRVNTSRSPTLSSRSCRHQCRHRCRSRPSPLTPRGRPCAGICGSWMRSARRSPRWRSSGTCRPASSCRRCCGSG